MIEHLAAGGWEVHVLTSGNGLSYFEGRDSIASLSSMASFFYSGTGTGISGWSTLKTVGALATRVKAKRQRLESLLDTIRPDIAVSDSEYALSPLRRRRIPIIGLNTSEIVVSEYLRNRQRADGTRTHFWFVEYLDYLFHRCFCDRVLSPFPLRTPTRHRKFQRIGLIVRRAVQEIALQTGRKESPSPRQLHRVVFMLSGSVHASQIPFDRYDLPFKIDVVGRSGEARRNLTFHGRQMNNVDLLAGADALVINGGYSALSEAFALRKRTFVIPVVGLAEQFVNACLARELGLGFIATETNVLDQLLEMHRQDRWVELKPLPARLEIDGAREAAQAIAAFCPDKAGAKRLKQNPLTAERARV